MGRPSVNHDPSIKKTAKKKKRRFERPRCRSPVMRLSNFSKQEDNVEFVDCAGDELSAFTDAASDPIGDGKTWDETSSFCEEFFDAEENKKEDSVAETNLLSCARVSMKIDRMEMSVTVEDGDGKRTLEVPVEDLANGGLEWTVLRCDDYVSVRLKLAEMARYDECTQRSKINVEAQTSVAFGAEEISETEDTSVMTGHSKLPTMKTIDEEEDDEKTRDVSPTSEAFMVSETSDEILNSFDSNKSVKNRAIAKSQTAKPPTKIKPLTDSTVSSIPMDTVTSETSRRCSSPSPDTSVLEDKGAESRSTTLPYIPLVKSKSDSLVLSAPKKFLRRKYDVQALMVQQAKYHRRLTPMPVELRKDDVDDWSPPYWEGDRIPDGCLTSWLEDGNDGKTESDVLHILEEVVRENEESQERPMTSAADAVKSMHRALKPISDQINDIRTKMIGMNIQPRTTSSQKFNLQPMSCKGFSYPPSALRINQWLLTDPQEFSGSFNSESSSALRAFELFADDSTIHDGAKSTKSFRHNNKLVIFPARFETSESIHTERSIVDDLNFSRSSIVTEPDDLLNKRDGQLRYGGL